MNPRELPPCDLVMKGGVTSGVVYPGAVVELARRYRFAKLGGTSAGAVAAAMTAACEFARQRSGAAELAGMLDVAEDLTRPGFFLALFRPTPSARPLLDLAWALARAGRPHRRQTAALARASVRHRPGVVAVSLLLAAALVVLTAAAFGRLPVILGIVLAAVVGVVVVLLITGALLGPLVSIVRDALRHVPADGFGVCTGLAAAGSPPALTDWLHASIQHCAGLPTDQPLTFADLEQEGISLRMVATDLGLARPATIPFAPEQYLFAPADLATLFPVAVVEHILATAGVGPEDRLSRRTWFLPAAELPVLVGVRLSASVPLVLASLKLYSARSETDGPVESHLVDGGITSNFPIHFFDDWLPGHPTFGLDLASVPELGDTPVFMPDGETVSRMPPAQAVQSVGAFLGRLQDAARNWRDELQAELPGFRDRVCQIRLAPGEGGVHLNAEPAAIAKLVARGHLAGREILEKFDWERHRQVRYLTLMALLRENFTLLADRFEHYRTGAGPAPADGMPSRDQWAAAVERAAAELIERVTALGPGGDQGEDLSQAAMRIGPRV